jgi:MFS family permease
MTETRSGTNDPPITGWTWVALAVTFVTQLTGTAVMYAPAILAPAAERDIGVTASAVGIMTSICYGGIVATILISGRAIARFGPLRWSQVCLLMLAVSAWLMMSAQLALVVLAGLILGPGYGALTPASSVILVRETPGRLRTTVLSVKQTGVPAGGALAGLMIPLLIGRFGWQGAVGLLGALCLLLAVLIQPVRRHFDLEAPSASPVAKQGLWASLRLFWKEARLREIGVMSFMYGGMQMMFVSFFVVDLTQQAGLTLMQAGGAMSAAMIGGVVARILWGVAGDRWLMPRPLLAWIGIATTVATVILAFVAAGWPLVAIYAVGAAMGMTALAWNGLFLAEVARIAPQGDVGMATSAALMLAFSGVVFFPSLCWGLIALTGSFRAMFLIMAALNLPVALLLFRRG